MFASRRLSITRSPKCVQTMSPTVLCILSAIAFAWGFFGVVVGSTHLVRSWFFLSVFLGFIFFLSITRIFVSRTFLSLLYRFSTLDTRSYAHGTSSRLLFFLVSRTGTSFLLVRSSCCCRLVWTDSFVLILLRSECKRALEIDWYFNIVRPLHGLLSSYLSVCYSRDT